MLHEYNRQRRFLAVERLTMDESICALARRDAYSYLAFQQCPEMTLDTITPFEEQVRT
jgi:hypothetical protein